MFPNVPLYAGFAVSLPAEATVLQISACFLLILSDFLLFVLPCVDPEGRQHARGPQKSTCALRGDGAQRLRLRPRDRVVELQARQKWPAED